MGIQQLPEQNPGIEEYKVSSPAYYRQQEHEVVTLLRAYAGGIPAVLKGPTGSGKTTMVAHVCYLLGHLPELKKTYGEELKKTGSGDGSSNENAGKHKSPLESIEEKTRSFQDGKGFPLVTASGHEDLDATTLKGRPIIIGEEPYFVNGPAKLATQYGGMFYFDEPAEARPDVHTVNHPLSDDRQLLPVEQLGLNIRAHESFHFVMSYNDRYQDPRKRFKPSTSQRFIHIPLGYPKPEVELEIILNKTGIAEGIAKKLLKIAEGTRDMALQQRIKEGASPRELILAARLINLGESPYEAALYCLAHPLTHEPKEIAAIEELIKNQFRK